MGFVRLERQKFITGLFRMVCFDGKHKVCGIFQQTEMVTGK